MEANISKAKKTVQKYLANGETLLSAYECKLIPEWYALIGGSILILVSIITLILAFFSYRMNTILMLVITAGAAVIGAALMEVALSSLKKASTFIYCATTDQRIFIFGESKDGLEIRKDELKSVQYEKKGSRNLVTLQSESGNITSLNIPVYAQDFVNAANTLVK